LSKRDPGIHSPLQIHSPLAAMASTGETKRFVPAMLEEMGVLLSIAVPTMVRYMAFQAADRATIALVGRYDPTPAHIAGTVLGKMYSNITGLSLGIGIAFGINTFAAQNFGAGASRENGIVLRQARRALCGAWAFSLTAALASKPLLEAMGQPEELLQPCQHFSLIVALGLPAVWLSFSMQSILVSQRIVLPSMICDGLAALSNLSLSYILLSRGFGFLGLAWATFLSYWVSLAFTVLYIVLSKRQETVWRVPSDPSKSLSMRRFLQTSLPSAFSMWVEWWAAEIMSVMAGLLPRAEFVVGAHGLLFNTAAIMYMAFCANANAATTRAGNLVGAKDTARVRPMIASGVLMAVSIAAAVSTFLYASGDSIFAFYTHDAEILADADASNLGMVLTMMPYSLMMLFLGVLRGADLQMWGAVNMFVSFYLFGLPLGAYLAFLQGMGLSGIWYGNAAGMAASAAGMLLKVIFINWEKLQSIDDGLQAPLLGQNEEAATQAKFADLESEANGNAAAGGA